MSVREQTRRYERIDISLPCRLYIPGEEGGLRFEAFARSRNLGLGGLFLESTFLVREGLELYVELGLPDGPLAIHSRVAHVTGFGRAEPSGIGLEFLDVDAHGRETLLRWFTPVRYERFYASVVGEFPHLAKELPLRDVSLVLNLWEEWKVRTAETAGDAAAGDSIARAPRLVPVARSPVPR